MPKWGKILGAVDERSGDNRFAVVAIILRFVSLIPDRGGALGFPTLTAEACVAEKFPENDRQIPQQFPPGLKGVKLRIMAPEAIVNSVYKWGAGCQNSSALNHQNRPL